MIRLGVILRAHQRANTLSIALSELLRLGKLPGLAVKIAIVADRPSASVQKVLDSSGCAVVSCPFPLVSAEHGEMFMEANNLGLNALLSLTGEPYDWLCMHDDDYWLEPEHATVEVPTALANEDVDMWYVRTVFMQDRPDRYNPNRHHHSPLFFRYLEGDRYPASRERMIHATALRHDDAICTGRIQTLKTPLLDYGSYSAAERQRLYDVYTRAGKTCSYIESLRTPTQLALFPQDAVAAGLMPDCNWRDLYNA
jgi:hypothetical protein